MSDGLFPPEEPEEAPSKRQPGLVERLCKLISTLDPLEKRGENKGQNYNYSMAEDVFAQLQKPMAAMGIWLSSSVYKVDRSLIPTKSGGNLICSIVYMKCRLHCAYTGEVISEDWMGEGSDSGDKSLQKAITSAEKNFLQRQYMMGASPADDPEFDGQLEPIGKKGKANPNETPAAARAGNVPPAPEQAKKPATADAKEPAAAEEQKAGQALRGRIVGGLKKLGIEKNEDARNALLSELLESFPKACPLNEAGKPTLTGATNSQLTKIADWIENAVDEMQATENIPF
jgi:hypothetical protein